MSHSHHQAADHSAGRGRRLLIALALNLTIAGAEVIGGVISGSLSLLADAAHNASDAASVLVSYIAWRIARRAADERHSFGYGRAETVGALINLTTLLMIGLYLLYEAGSRLLAPTGAEPVGTTMLVVGVIALTEDLLAAWVLRKELGSLNVKSTYLHMIADALATVGVIFAGIAIMFWGPSAAWVDAAVTGVIALYIFWHGGREMHETISVLLDTAPPDFDHDGLAMTMRSAPGVVEVRHVHIWRREENRLALEAHLVVDDPDLGAATEMKDRLRIELKERFDIALATFEVELLDRAALDRSLPGEDTKKL